MTGRYHFAAAIKVNRLAIRCYEIHAFDTAAQRDNFTLERYHLDYQRLSMPDSAFLTRHVEERTMQEIEPGHVAGVCDPDWLRYVPD